MTELSVDFMHADAFTALPWPDPERLYAVPDDGRFPVMVAVVEDVNWTYEDDWRYSTKSKHVSYSLDGFDWRPSLDYPPELMHIFGFSYGNGVFMAANLYQPARSYDGVRWELCPGYLGLNVDRTDGIWETHFAGNCHFQFELSAGGVGQEKRRLLGTYTGALSSYFVNSGAVTAMFGIDDIVVANNGWAACCQYTQNTTRFCRSQINENGGMSAWAKVSLPEDVYSVGLANSVSAGAFAMFAEDIYNEDGDRTGASLSVVYSEDGFATRDLIWSGESHTENESDACRRFGAKRVPGAALEYRYYMTREGYVWFSTDCVRWSKIDNLPYRDGWRIADMYEGPGPTVFYANSFDGQPAKVAVGDISSFQLKDLPNTIIENICVGMSGPGMSKRDYASMLPDIANCADATDLAVLAYPSDKVIALTKADVYFPNSTDYSGFTAPDAGWFYAYLSATAVGNGAQVVITPPDDVGSRMSLCRCFRQYRGATTIRLFAPVQKGCHVGYAVVGTASKIVFKNAHFRYAVGTAPED